MGLRVICWNGSTLAIPIFGQTIQSGAVYLLQRKKSDIESLLKPRENYREEILKDFHVQEENAQPTKVKD